MTLGHNMTINTQISVINQPNHNQVELIQLSINLFMSRFLLQINYYKDKHGNHFRRVKKKTHTNTQDVGLAKAKRCL